MKQEKVPLVGRKDIVPFVLITSLFFLWGFARAILDVLNKHFQTALDISISQSSLIQVTTYLGYFITAIPAGIFINKYGYRRGVVVGLLLFAIGAFLFVPGAQLGTFYAYLVALFVIGIGLTFLETSANPYSTELGPKETATSRLNLSQSFNGLGCIFAPLLVGSFLFNEDNPNADVSLPYTIMGVLVIIVALIFSQVKLPEIVHEEKTELSDGSSTGNLKALFHHKMFLFGLAALLAYEVGEISINSYFVNFVTGEGWMQTSMATKVLSLALAFFMIGRFIGSWIMRRIKAQTMLFICATGSVICMALVLTGVKGLSLTGLIGNYVFEAIMFPTIFSLALEGLGKLTKTASSILMMTPVGGCGFLLMGIIADSTTFILPFIVPFIGFIIVWAYALKLKKAI